MQQSKCEILIIGGGIAGVSTVRYLAQYGHDVTLFSWKLSLWGKWEYNKNRDSVSIQEKRDMFTSEQLTEGEVYTRNDLREKFNIKDATINNGVFRPAGYQSIWLFVTEQKTNDMPQLSDLLEGNMLRWDGQPSGRTDKLIIEHERDGYELLVFYRKHKSELPKSGFRYEGRFQYESYRDGQPAHFVLRRLMNSHNDEKM